MNVYEFLRSILDIVFPPEEETLLVRATDERGVEKFLCPRNVNGCVVLSDFGDKHIRALIHEAKFHMNASAQRLLGHLCACYLTERSELRSAHFIPIPLASARYRERGYNQVLEILRFARDELPWLSIEYDVLARSRNTHPQTELPKQERERNVVGAFSVVQPERVRGLHIVIVDDVMTTGATLRAAKAALLLHAPASVTCIALAH